MHKAYLGQKQFSVEGLDMTVPMIDEIIQRRLGGTPSRPGGTPPYPTPGELRATSSHTLSGSSRVPMNCALHVA